jgi:hypothetical protein
MTYKEGPMKLRTFAAFVFGLAAAGAVSAQDLPVRANIPFNFVVSGVTLPAGEYAFHQAANSVVIKATHQAVSVVSLTNPAEDPSARLQAPRVVFHRYGDQYFLYQTWAGDRGSQVPVTRPERILLSHKKVPSQAVVAALQ